MNKKVPNMELTQAQKEELLLLARKSVEAAAHGTAPPSVIREEPSLKTPCGLFVTITQKGNLRGCIGFIQGINSLRKGVVEAAVSAAIKDPRFPPVSPKELPDIEIEISILSPFRRISNISEIEVGKHGLYIEKGYQRGLLLPQVAAEHKWDLETFLQHTCIKAGLAPHMWKDQETIINIFTSDIISQTDVDS